MTAIFFNHCFDKRKFNIFLHWFLKKRGHSGLIQFLEQLKFLGFHISTEAGLSISIEDLKTPDSKALNLLNIENIIFDTDVDLDAGNITIIEKYQRIIEKWNRASETIKYEILQSFKISNFFNPVYLMAFSGARGNISQIRQLAGMRGLMSDPLGQIIDFPIRSNFREGLTLTEYLISCSGARKGIVDTALRTAASGYLTRRLVDVAHNVIINQIDCQKNFSKKKGIYLENLYDYNNKILPLNQRLVGRILAETVFEENFNVIASKNQEISRELSAKICKHNNRILVRSPLTCQSSKFLCQYCYGWNLAEGQMVSIGEAVGILAAQSIGEPGTQLTMRTFHTGGVFTGTLIDQIYSPFCGNINYESNYNGLLIRTQYGKIAYLSKNHGIINIKKKKSRLGINSIKHLKIFKKIKNFKFFKYKKIKYSKYTRSIKYRLNKFNLTIKSNIFNVKIKKNKIINKFKSFNFYKNIEKKASIYFESNSLLYTKQNEFVLKKQIIAEVPFVNNEISSNNEQQVLSNCSGELYFEKLTLLEKTEYDIKENFYKFKLDISVLKGAGNLWILLGGLIKNKKISFFKKFDLIDNKIPIYQISIKNFVNNFTDYSLWLEKKFVYKKLRNINKQIFFEVFGAKFIIFSIFFKSIGYVFVDKELYDFKTYIIGLENKTKFINEYSKLNNKFFEFYFSKIKENYIYTKKHLFFINNINIEKFFCELKKLKIFNNYYIYNDLVIYINRQGHFKYESFSLTQNKYFYLSSNLGKKLIKTKNVKDCVIFRNLKVFQNISSNWTRTKKIYKPQIINWHNFTLNIKNINLLYLYSKTNINIKKICSLKNLKIGIFVLIRIIICYINKDSNYSQFTESFNIYKNKLFIDFFIKSFFSFIKNIKIEEKFLFLKNNFYIKNFQNVFNLNNFCNYEKKWIFFGNLNLKKEKLTYNILKKKAIKNNNLNLNIILPNYIIEHGNINKNKKLSNFSYKIKRKIIKYFFSLIKILLKKFIFFKNYKARFLYKKPKNALVFEKNLSKSYLVLINNLHKKVKKNVLYKSKCKKYSSRYIKSKIILDNNKILKRQFDEQNTNISLKNISFLMKKNKKSYYLLSHFLKNNNFYYPTLKYNKLIKKKKLFKINVKNLNFRILNICKNLYFKNNFSKKYKIHKKANETFFNRGLKIKIPMFDKIYDITFNKINPIPLKYDFYEKTFSLNLFINKFKYFKEFLTKSSIKIILKNYPIENQIFLHLLNKLDSPFIEVIDSLSNDKKYTKFLFNSYSDLFSFNIKNINYLDSNFLNLSRIFNRNNKILILGSLIKNGENFFNNKLLLNSGQFIAKTQEKFLFRKAVIYMLNNDNILYVKHGDLISKNQCIYNYFYTQYKTGDIVQGIPKIEEIFEARKKSNHIELKLYKHLKNPNLLENSIETYLKSLQKSIVNNIQKIYCNQGINISDKHIEIIVRQMTSNVIISEPGKTGLLYGETIKLQWVNKINSILKSNKIKYEPIITGMTKSCLITSNFISAASFQETTRILGKAAIQNQIDFVRGLKQNVILGNLIPAGTGLFK